MKVSRLFVLNSLLSAKRPGRHITLALNAWPTPPVYNTRGIVFYISRGRCVLSRGAGVRGDAVCAPLCYSTFDHIDMAWLCLVARSTSLTILCFT